MTTARKSRIAGQAIIAWVVDNDAELFENATPFKAAARRIGRDLTADITYQSLASIVRTTDGLRWKGRNKRLIYGERHYASKTWGRLYRLLDSQRDRFTGRTPAAVAQLLLADGPAFAIPAIAEMMRLLKLNPREST